MSTLSKCNIWLLEYFRYEQFYVFQCLLWKGNQKVWVLNDYTILRSLWQYVTGQCPNFGPYCKHLSHFVPQPQKQKFVGRKLILPSPATSALCRSVSEQWMWWGLDRGLQYLLCGECDQMSRFGDRTATSQFRVRPRSWRYSSQGRIVCWHRYSRREYRIIGAWCPSPHRLLWGTWFEQFMLVTILVPANTT